MKSGIPDPGFWRDRRVFVTGHTGFKGSWLVLWLEHMGARVCGYALPPSTRPSLFDTLHADGERHRSTMADLADGTALRQAVIDFAPEIVFHLAAQAIVRQSYVDPVETFGTNVMGTVNLLEAVRAAPSVRSVVVVTSDKCYLNREWLWGYRENEPLGGHDPYSASKACAELVAASYRKSFLEVRAGEGAPVRLATARAGNVIGGGDWSADRLVPDTVQALSRGEPVRVRNPDATRPWQHVLEPLSGYLVLAERLTAGALDEHAYNFGPDESNVGPVRQVVETLCRQWPRPGSFEFDERTGVHEAHLLKLDSSLARFALGWRPVWTLAPSLQLIVDWHLAFSAGEGMRSVSISQIERYSADAVPAKASTNEDITA